MNGISPQMAKLILAQENGLLDSDVGRAVERSFHHLCAGAFEQEHLETVVNIHEIAMARCPFVRPRGPRHGDFLLGYIPGTTEELRIPHEWMGSPSLIIGSTGSGKTNLAKQWILELGKRIQGSLVIDCMKREMPMLAPLLEQQGGGGVSVLDIQDLKLNPMMVPDYVSRSAFASTLADSIVRVLDAPPVARKITQQAIHHLFEQKTAPTLFDFREFIRSAKQFHPQSREALITALDPLLMSLRNVLSYEQGWNILSLTTQRIILGLNTGSQAERNLIIETLLFSLFSSLVAQGVSNVDPSILIYLDESSSLLESNDTAISNWIGLVRGVGLSLLLSNQSAVSISQKVLSNIPNLILGQCSSCADLNVMSSAMGFDSRQKQFAMNHLRPGLFVARLGRGRWRKPFLFTTPLLKSSRRKIPYHISSELAQLPFVESVKDQTWQPEWARKAAIPNKAEPLLLENLNQQAADEIPNGIPLDSQDATQSDNSSSELNADEIRLLAGVVKYPCKPVSFFPSELHISKSKLLRLRKSLRAKKMIVEQDLQTSKRGRPSRILAPTEQGKEALEKILSEK